MVICLCGTRLKSSQSTYEYRMKDWIIDDLLDTYFRQKFEHAGIGLKHGQFWQMLHGMNYGHMT